MSSTLKHSGRWFIQGIYKDVVHDPRLSCGAKATFVALMAFVSSSSPFPFPSMDHLSRILRVNSRTVQKYIDELVTVGLLKKEQQRGAGRFRSNSYTLYDTFPENRVEAAIRDNTDVIKTDSSNSDSSNSDSSKPDNKGEATVKRPQTKEKITTITLADAQGSGSGDVIPQGAPPPLPPQPLSPAAEEAAFFTKAWIALVRKIKGHRLELNQETKDRIVDWFERHPKWIGHDLMWVAFQAMLKAENNPRPGNGRTDNFLYCRFAHSPQWFVPNKRDGACKVFETAQELRYNREMDQDEINEKISKYFRSQEAP